ncbi:MAG: RDD family protein, partial [Syntrophobacterales bacterium]
MGTAKETLKIQTPEHVGFQYVLAGLGTRATAFLLDTAFRGLFIFFIFLTMLFLGRLLPELDPSGLLSDLSKNWILALAVLAYGVVDLGYFLLFEALWSGQTPGKRLQKLRVIRVN